MRGFFAAIVALGALPAGLAQSLLSPSEFRDEVMAAMTSAGGFECIEAVNEWSVRFGKTPDACEAQLFIDNTYSLYKDSPADREFLIERLAGFAVSNIVRGEEIGTTDRERLVVLLRPENYLRGTGTLFEDAPKLVSRPFAGDLFALLMLDSPTALRAVRVEDLSDLGLSQDEAFGLATTNLRNLMGPVERVIDEETGIEIVGAPSALGSGVLWLPEACTAETEPYVVHLWDRDSYIAAKFSDSQALEAFSIMTANMIAAQDTLHNTILYCIDGEWVAATPELTGPD